jgi:hypothetical protein
MAAVVAHQHAGLWNRRPEHSFHVPEMHFTGMMPSYNAPRSAIHAPSLRNYQPPTTQMDMNLPLFSTNTMPTSVPYQSSAVFAYDSSVNPYTMPESSMPQTYPMTYSSAMSPGVSYAATSAPQSLHTVREAHHEFALHANHMVKSESASPVQSGPMYSDASYATSCKRSSSEPADATNPHFATDVDTLMKAIQAKQTTSPQTQEVAKVSPSETKPLWSTLRTDLL